MKEYKLVNFCEFDPFATKSYCAIHNVDEKLNLGDITKVDENEIEDFNMIVGGSPCQDFSVAGKQQGAVWKCKKCGHEYNPLTVHWSKRDKCPECDSEELDKTRSSLLVEWLRIIRGANPNFGMYENVKNIVGKQFKETTFKIFEEELHEYGYNTYWQVLNAKDYGIPQNRERVYLVLIKKELDNGKLIFPKGFDNGIRLKDILEGEVDNKYYIDNEKAKNLLINITSKTTGLLSNQGTKFEKETEYANTLLARDYKGFGNQAMNCVIETNEQKRLGGIYDDKTKHQAGSVWDTNYIAPTVDTMQGGNRQPCIVENNHPQYRIRKLTPKECFRLMGFSDEDYEKAKAAGISNSQLYKQSGNSIVTDVPFYILLELYKVMPYLFDDLKLSSFFSGIGAFEKALDRLYKYINEGVNLENFTQPQVV